MNAAPDEGQPGGDSLLILDVVPAKEADEHVLLVDHALRKELPRDQGVGDAADLVGDFLVRFIKLKI